MTDPVITGLEAELRQAQLDGDVAALDRLIADDLLFTGPDGRLATKAEDLAAYRNGVMRVTSHDPKELRVHRVRPDVAVAALQARMTGVLSGNHFDVIARYTRVWAIQDGRWQIVAGQVAVQPVPPDDLGRDSDR